MARRPTKKQVQEVQKTLSSISNSAAEMGIQVICLTHDYGKNNLFLAGNPRQLDQKPLVMDIAYRLTDGMKQLLNQNGITLPEEPATTEEQP
jgi:hypothetical protein